MTKEEVGNKWSGTEMSAWIEAGLGREERSNYWSNGRSKGRSKERSNGRSKGRKKGKKREGMGAVAQSNKEVKEGLLFKREGRSLYCSHTPEDGSHPTFAHLYFLSPSHADTHPTLGYPAPTNEESLGV